MKDFLKSVAKLFNFSFWIFIVKINQIKCRLFVVIYSSNSRSLLPCAPLSNHSFCLSPQNFELVLYIREDWQPVKSDIKILFERNREIIHVLIFWGFTVVIIILFQKLGHFRSGILKNLFSNSNNMLPNN